MENQVCRAIGKSMKNGWTIEMIDRLPIYRGHTWRKRRLFLLDDLKKVSPVFRIKTENLKKKPKNVKENAKRTGSPFET